MLILICLVAAFVCFVLAAINIPNVPPRPNLIATGLALWVLTLLLEAARAVGR